MKLILNDLTTSLAASVSLVTDFPVTNLSNDVPLETCKASSNVLTVTFNTTAAITDIAGFYTNAETLDLSISPGTDGVVTIAGSAITVGGSAITVSGGSYPQMDLNNNTYLDFFSGLTDSTPKDFWLSLGLQDASATVTLTLTSATGTQCYLGTLRSGFSANFSNPTYGASWGVKDNWVQLAKASAAKYRRERRNGRSFAGEFSLKYDNEAIEVIERLKQHYSDSPRAWLLPKAPTYDRPLFGGISEITNTLENFPTASIAVEIAEEI